MSANPLPTPAPDAEKALTVTLLGFAITLVLGAMSTGVHHLDDLTHFLMARWAWTRPEYFVHAWGRPGFTVLYAIPAALGWAVARAWSAILCAIIAWLSYCIAAKLGLRHAWLAPVFVYAQPRFVTLSMTTLTETAMGFYLTLAVWLALRAHWRAAFIVLSPALLSRHEAAVLIPVFVLAAWFDRGKIRDMACVLWAPLAWLLAAWLLDFLPVGAVVASARGSGAYEPGGWHAMFARSVEAFGPGIAAIGLAGAATVARRRGGPLVVGCVAAYILTHVFLKWFGLFDTGGYGRFLVPVSGLYGVMALAAWTRLCQSDPIRRARTAGAIALAALFFWAAAELQINRNPLGAEVKNLYQAMIALRVMSGAMVLTALVVIWSRRRKGAGVPPTTVPLRVAVGGSAAFTLWAMCGPLHPGDAQRAVDRDITWFRQSPYADRRVVTLDPWAIYRLDIVSDPRRKRFAKTVAEAGPGAIIIWDAALAGGSERPLVPLDEFTPPRYRRLNSPSRESGRDDVAWFEVEPNG
jgi:hypothetical protein